MENFLRCYLGDPRKDFLEYQLRRITMTTVMHILYFPLSNSLVYFVSLAAFTESQVFALWPTTIIQWAASLTILLTIVAIGLVGQQGIEDFEDHRIVKKFRQFGDDWRVLSEQVTREIQDPFAVIAVDSDQNGLYVLDHWIVHFTPYNMDIAKLEDARFVATKVIQHPLSNQNQDFQIVVVRVESASLSFLPFEISLKSRNILQLIQDKIDEFIPVFRACISENEPFQYSPTEELDTCFGCMAVQPNVKIDKTCGGPECTNCACRPSWCHSCLARIFASEQDEEQSHTWLRGTARCPTCRSRFCPLDVRPLVIV
ncbi:Transmembrane protein [Aphelenchoides fujianensis]|nr:Transmembrane protein [Aphelenchoides fujianensis]